MSFEKCLIKMGFDVHQNGTYYLRLPPSGKYLKAIREVLGEAVNIWLPDDIICNRQKNEFIGGSYSDEVGYSKRKATYYYAVNVLNAIEWFKGLSIDNIEQMTWIGVKAQKVKDK